LSKVKESIFIFSYTTPKANTASVASGRNNSNQSLHSSQHSSFEIPHPVYTLLKAFYLLHCCNKCWVGEEGNTFDTF
jgi:hypothetical protein